MEMFIAAMSFDVSTGRAAIVLTDEKKERALPIFIGPFECSAIAVALNNIKPARPLSHDLMLNMITELGWVVKAVEVTELDEGRYLASIRIKSENPLTGELIEKSIDARPSDAIAIALRAKAPILVAPEVVAAGAIPTNAEQEKSNTEEFKKFVETLKATDFNKYAQSRGRQADPGGTNPDQEWW